MTWSQKGRLFYNKREDQTDPYTSTMDGSRDPQHCGMIMQKGVSVHQYLSGCMNIDSIIRKYLQEGSTPVRMTLLDVFYGAAGSFSIAKFPINFGVAR